MSLGWAVRCGIFVGDPEAGHVERPAPGEGEEVHVFATLTVKKTMLEEFAQLANELLEKTRGELLRNQIKEYERYKAERAHMQEFVDKFRYNAKRASLVQSRLTAIEKLVRAPVAPRGQLFNGTTILHCLQKQLDSHTFCE